LLLVSCFLDDGSELLNLDFVVFDFIVFFSDVFFIFTDFLFFVFDLFVLFLVLIVFLDQFRFFGVDFFFELSNLVGDPAISVAVFAFLFLYLSQFL
jgi:hypothetical protein